MDRRYFIKSSGATLAGTSSLVLPWSALAADEIGIGSIHDLSGGLDIYGKPMLDALTLAIEEQNAAGGLLGKKLKLVSYDPQSNMQMYAQFAQQASLKDKVAVVHGGITSASREVIRPVLNKNKTLYFYNTQYEGGVCDRGTFCTGVTPAQTVAKLVPYAMKKWGKKVYVIAADYNYGQITSQWVKKFTLDNGGSVASIDFFPLDVTNFGPTISKIEAAKPDMVVSALVGGAAFVWGQNLGAAKLRFAVLAAAAVFSHWLLDALVHAPELPLAGADSPKVGLWLWQTMPVALTVESVLVVAGICLFIPGTSLSRAKKVSLTVFSLLILAFTVIGMTLAPAPPSAVAMATSSLATVVVVCALGCWLGWLPIETRA